jgi:hypothetical protein
MDTPDSTAPEPEQDPDVEVITVDTALGNAVRLLQHAEMESNLALMERLEGLADSWLNVAQILLQL